MDLPHATDITVELRVLAASSGLPRRLSLALVEARNFRMAWRSGVGDQQFRERIHASTRAPTPALQRANVVRPLERVRIRRPREARHPAHLV
jgi:hypothetical protein